MTPRQLRLVNASDAVDAAKGRIARILHTVDKDVADAWGRDIAALDLASKTVMAVAEDPENFGKVMELRAKKPREFEAIMVLVRIELERPAPTDQQVAA
jgi:hypothetical protein